MSELARSDLMGVREVAQWAEGAMLTLRLDWSAASPERLAGGPGFPDFRRLQLRDGRAPKVTVDSRLPLVLTYGK